MDKMRYPRKKGYAGRYVRHELGKNKLNLLLGCVFLLGALVGWPAGWARSGDNFVPTGQPLFRNGTERRIFGYGGCLLCG